MSTHKPVHNLLSSFDHMQPLRELTNATTISRSMLKISVFILLLRYVHIFMIYHKVLVWMYSMER